MPSRASFMTERYVRDHGVYTNWAEIPPDSPTYAWALREAGYHTVAAGQGAPLPRRAAHGRHTWTTWPDASRRSASPRSSRRATSSSAKIPTRYTDYLAGRGPARRLQASTSPTAATRARTKTVRTRPSACPMWDSTPMPIPLESYVDAWHGQQAVRVDRALRPRGAVLPLRRLPRAARPLGRAGGGRGRATADVDISMPRSTDAPDGRGDGPLRRAAERVPLDLRLRDDDRRRHPGHAALLRRRHLGHRPGGRATWSTRWSARGCWTTRGSSTRATTARWRGNHGLMSKCVLYEPAVRVPADRPPAGWVRAPASSTRWWSTSTCRPRVRDDRRRARRRRTARGGRSSACVARRGRRPRAPSRSARTGASPPSRPSATSWSSTRTPCAPCQLFDLAEDPAEDHDLLPDPAAAPSSEEIMETHVRPFFRTPPARPHPSIFTGGRRSTSSRADQQPRPVGQPGHARSSGVPLDGLLAGRRVRRRTERSEAPRSG